MKHLRLTVVCTLFALMSGCGEKEAENVPLPVMEVSKDLPKKELILQDLFDVEYIPLQTTDESVTRGVVRAIGEKYIVTTNYREDGDIFIFDRSGKAIRKINRRGQGPEEYLPHSGMNIVLDEANEEFFLNNVGIKKTVVYDMQGRFKRILPHEGVRYMTMFDYDKEHLICFDDSWRMKDKEPRGNRSFHHIVSKQDGSVAGEIFIPYDVIRSPIVNLRGGGYMSFLTPTITPHHDNWILTDYSTDTLYSYLPKENILKPFMVKTQEPDVVVRVGAVTDRYCFMIVDYKEEVDISRREMPRVLDIVYDKQENTIYEVKKINGDYTKEQEIKTHLQPLSATIAAYQTLDTPQLMEAYANNELQGRLKEVAAGLNEEDNPVIMILKYKKK
jgi:hypothetical protein